MFNSWYKIFFELFGENFRVYLSIILRFVNDRKSFYIYIFKISWFREFFDYNWFKFMCFDVYLNIVKRFIDFLKFWVVFLWYVIRILLGKYFYRSFVLLVL